MSRKSATSKRSRLIDAAAKLVHEQGFHRTTLADISDESGVPLGNLSYYFKTKDAIGEAVVDRLARAYDALRETWESTPDPRARLARFIQMTMDNREALSRSGCPVGTLCAELSKEEGVVGDRATRVFGELLHWIETQFRLLGKGAQSADLANHLLSAIEGVSLLALAFHDSKLVERESRYLQRWLRDLAS
jgi:TetR/AcrR family transcriptional regulator, transcriptional repressor for nem operon